MLGKEDVLLWFKDLESYKRIEVMYELLNMCIPFEIRFLGSCIEEIGKHTYQELRGPSIIANDAERLAKDTSLQAGLADDSARQRAIIYMSVLNARNCTCANWYYRTFLRATDPHEQVVNVLSGREKDLSSVISELLLFYTLGLYHPAFTFEQKTHFREALEALNRHCNSSNGRNVAAPTGAAPCSAVGCATSEAAIPAIARNVSSHVDQSVVPVKPQTVIAVDPILIPPHGLQNAPPKLRNFVFASGPPEAHPFPAQSSKHPANSQPRREISPPQSPLLASVVLPPPCQIHQQPPMPPLQDLVALQPPLHLDTNLVSPGPPFVPPPEPIPISIEEEKHFISEDKRDVPWQPNDLTKQNGIRFKNMYPPHESFANLKIDPEKPPMMLCSNSNSSSSSSRNQSPIETPPSVTPAVTPHGPGRGPQPPPLQQPPPQAQQPDAKPRVNGLPPPSLRLIGPQPTCDAPPFTVPSYPPSFPARYYSYRPPFPPSFHAALPPPNNDMLFNYQPQLFYSSVPHPTPRNPNCCNCGGLGHTSVDCTSQSVEDITQTPYTLDFDSPTVPENPPEK